MVSNPHLSTALMRDTRTVCTSAHTVHIWAPSILIWRNTFRRTLENVHLCVHIAVLHSISSQIYEGTWDSNMDTFEQDTDVVQVRNKHLKLRNKPFWYFIIYDIDNFPFIVCVTVRLISAQNKYGALQKVTQMC